MTVYIGVGSNIRADANVIKAIALLSDRIHVLSCSTFYETLPERRMRQTNYINGIIRAESDLSPLRLRKTLRNVERIVGRRRKRGADPYSARPIDLDILLYGDRIIHTGRLDIPDKHIVERPYLCVPLAELDPSLVLPGNGPISKAAAMTETGGMIALHGVTAEIRRYLKDE